MTAPATKWMYHGKGGWYFYDDVSHAIIESHYAKGATSCDIRIGSIGYQINFKSMMQTSALNPLKTRHIKRGTSHCEQPPDTVITLIFKSLHYIWHPRQTANELYSKTVLYFHELTRKRGWHNKIRPIESN